MVQSSPLALEAGFGEATRALLATPADASTEIVADTSAGSSSGVGTAEVEAEAGAGVGVASALCSMDSATLASAYVKAMRQQTRNATAHCTASLLVYTTAIYPAGHGLGPPEGRLGFAYDQLPARGGVASGYGHNNAGAGAGSKSSSFLDMPVCYAIVTNRALAPAFRAYGSALGPWIVVEVDDPAGFGKGKGTGNTREGRRASRLPKILPHLFFDSR